MCCPRSCRSWEGDDVDPVLRNPWTFANWVWLLGAVMIAFALLWVVSLLVAYRVALVEKRDPVRTLGQLQRARYNRQIAEVATDFGAGRMDSRGAHFALASLIRAAATEKTGVNVESQTAAEAAYYVPSWPLLARALDWCEDETFPVEGATQQVEAGLELAREVVNG